MLAASEHQGKIVAQYRKAKQWSQQQLADALGVQLRTVQRIEAQAEITDMNRRQLLVYLLGIPATVLRIEAALYQEVFQTPLRINSDRMAFFEQELIARWEVYHIGGPGRANIGMQDWMKQASMFAASAKGTPWQTRAGLLLSMSYQLAGSIKRDLLDYSSAQRAFRKAYAIAAEIGNAELMAAALSREGTALIMQGKPQEAVHCLYPALEITTGKGWRQLRGHTLKAISEAHALMQNKQDCWRSIGLVERMMEAEKTQPEWSQMRFDGASIIAQKGVDAFYLGDCERAIHLIDKSLATYDPTLIRRRARLIIQKAEAYFRIGQLDTSVYFAEEAFLLAKSVQSQKNIAYIHAFHETLMRSPQGNEPCVARLGVVVA